AGFEQVPQFEVSLTADASQAVLNLDALKTPPGDYLIAFYGSAVAKYRYNPEAIPAAEAAHKKSQDEAAALAAEVQRLTAEATAAPAEKQGEAGKAVTDATARKQAADAAVVATAGR